MASSSNPGRDRSRADVIVVGLGAMGSAAAYHLARRGRRVVGFDRHRPPHAYGSSHGDTRIIREAYFEHPVYVPMVQRAYELWDDLEQSTGMSLYRRTGGLMLGPPASDLITGSLRSAREHGLGYELLSCDEIRERFPALHPERDMVGVFEPRAGVLFAEQCVAAHLAGAREAGAELHLEEPVSRWDVQDDGGVRVATSAGTYSAGQLIVMAGAWAGTVAPDANLPLSVERQTLFWFSPDAPTEVLEPDRCPVHLWQFDGGRFFYGFPDLGGGIKVACHHGGASVTPDAVDRTVSTQEIAEMKSLVERFVPAALGMLRKTGVCLYTNTPDGHFWIDRHPVHRQVLIVSPCSGHGFKFAPVIGEIIADTIVDGAARFDLSLFKAR